MVIMTDEKEKEVVETTVPEVTPQTDLSILASRVQNDVSIAQSVTPDTLDNMKLFLIVYSRSQVERIIKLTNRLQELEDRLLAKSDEVVDIYDLMNIIKLIQGSLDRSIDAIKQITKNEEYMQVVINNANIINNQMNTYNGINSTRDLSMRYNQDSRERVRSAMSKIIEVLNQEESEELAKASNIVDAEVVNEVTEKDKESD